MQLAMTGNFDICPAFKFQLPQSCVALLRVVTRTLSLDTNISARAPGLNVWFYVAATVNPV